MRLEAQEIRKSFPGVKALDGVSLSVQGGEVLALVGENGAGKSTLMKILAGVQSPDSGELRLDGQPVRFADVREAQASGISLIHQELNLAENLDVTANLFLGRERTKFSWLQWLDRAAMRREAAGMMSRVGLDASLADTLVGSLSPGQRQLVEIARALSMDARIIIFDEPTSSLTQRETERLFEVVGELKKQGVGIVWISHRLGEVMTLADRVTVFRDGKNAGELSRSELSHESMVRLMVGRDLKQFYPRNFRTRAASSEPVLEITDIVYPLGKTTSEPISFSLFAGEVVGMSGLIGSGRTELAETLYGLRRMLGGEVRLAGRPLTLRNPTAAIEAGLLLVPEDRRHHGLVLQESIRNNLSLPNLLDLASWGLVSSSRERELARSSMERLKVRASGPAQPVGLLSGGNQQKVVLGKWLARPHRVIIFDEPTRGVDVGAKAEIYALIDGLASQGAAVLMISSDLEEILGMSDRVLVLHEGRLAGELSRRNLSEQAVMRLATGSDALASV